MKLFTVPDCILHTRVRSRALGIKLSLLRYLFFLTRKRYSIAIDKGEITKVEAFQDSLREVRLKVIGLCSFRLFAIN